MKNLIMLLIALVATGVWADGDKAKVSAWEKGGRAETLKWFAENQFGVTPLGRPSDMKINERSVTFADGRITIDITLALPKGASKDKPVPVFLFGDHKCEGKPPYKKFVFPNIPTNAITARGYAYVTFNMNDVCPNASRWTRDLDRWADGVIAWQATGDPKARRVKRTMTSWGTLGAWAWGCSRVMDWIETRPELDAKRVAVLGVSRGGKMALWAAAQDTRFAMGISSVSGCGGAKLNKYPGPRNPTCQDIDDILFYFPNWFALNYADWVGRDREITRDSDDLLRLIAPRLCYVASATQDVRACPAAERASWELAHDLWEAYGCPERMGYHIREGKHDLLPYDWEKFMDFADKHMR